MITAMSAFASVISRMPEGVTPRQAALLLAAARVPVFPVATSSARSLHTAFMTPRLTHGRSQLGGIDTLQQFSRFPQVASRVSMSSTLTCTGRSMAISH